jgi:5-carboxymethyl-2-hydroxymuconate isomerase
MKLLSFAVGSRESFGVALEGGIVDLRSCLDPRIDSIETLLAGGAVEEVRRVVANRRPELPFDSIRYLRPVPFPEKIFCVGVNYPERNAEYRDGTTASAYPSIFMRTPGSLAGHLEPIVRPRESAQLDYEGEIAIVIGRRGRRIPERDVEGFVAGVTCVNEGTVRDWARHGKFNVTQGKNFERSGAMGPWIATLDEAGALDALTVTTRVNGAERQRGSSGDMLFSIRRLVAYISTFSELAPGDVIVTGTPPGAGARFDPPRFLQPGDRVEITINGVGTLSNTVVAES